MHPSTFIYLIYAIWIVIVVYLTVTAFTAKRDTKPHLAQSFILLFAIIAAFLLPRLSIFRFLNFHCGFIVGIIGVFLCIAGFGFLVWGRQTIGKNWSQTVSAKKGGELVTSGPYRIVRHPMYAGGLLACATSAMMVGGPFIFLFILLATLFIWRVFAEDRLMARQFPHEFPAYKNRTKALIPFIW